MTGEYDFGGKYEGGNLLGCCGAGYGELKGTHSLRYTVEYIHKNPNGSKGKNSSGVFVVYTRRK